MNYGWITFICYIYGSCYSPIRSVTLGRLNITGPLVDNTENKSCKQSQLTADIIYQHNILVCLHHSTSTYTFVVKPTYCVAQSLSVVALSQSQQYAQRPTSQDDSDSFD